MYERGGKLRDAREALPGVLGQRAAQHGVPMQVNVIGTLMFVIAISIVLVGEFGRRRRVTA